MGWGEIAIADTMNIYMLICEISTSLRSQEGPMGEWRALTFRGQKDLTLGC
jgi:hypothetical protein